MGRIFQFALKWFVHPLFLSSVKIHETFLATLGLISHNVSHFKSSILMICYHVHKFSQSRSFEACLQTCSKCYQNTGVLFHWVIDLWIQLIFRRTYFLIFLSFFHAACRIFFVARYLSLFIDGSTIRSKRTYPPRLRLEIF